MFDFTPPLPIDAVLPQICEALARAGQLVLQAPPGAGKTTRVPLALDQAGGFAGKIIMLEPRRLAARASAARLAEYYGEEIGQTVGLRMRGETQVSDATRIEVVTEGVLTAMIQSDPELAGIDCILFDEFHERSLNADLGLALALDIRRNLRDDLAIVVMSATLDAAPIAEFMDAPVVTAEGRSFHVEARYSDKPVGFLKGRDFATAMAALINAAIGATEGDILAFCPGEGEIRRIEALLEGTGVEIHPLYGALPFAAQQKAIRPSKGRKLVLATAIAETSLTIDGIKVVVDGGLARRARFDAGSGMSRLVTERVSKAEATQRMGRAGRLSEGVCYKLWAKGEEGAMQDFAPPEIETADLTGFVLELAAWGVKEAQDLPLITQPKSGDVAAAQELLQLMGALDQDLRLTDKGRAMAKIPTHPRLAAMLLAGGEPARMLVSLLEERDPLPRHAPKSIDLRVKALRNPKDAPFPIARAVADRIKARAAKLKASGSITEIPSLLAIGFPDRIGKKRKGAGARYHLSGGKGAVIEEDADLGAHEYIVAIDLDGDAREARLRLGHPITLSQIEDTFADQITWVADCVWSKREGRVLAQQSRKLGALALETRKWKDAPVAAKQSAILDGITQLGLGALHWDKKANLLRARIARAGDDLPDVSDHGLMSELKGWLSPYLGNVETKADLKKINLHEALSAMLNWEQSQTLDQLVPAAIKAPTGTKLAIDYSGEQPKISVRIQELFGMTKHPTIGAERIPLLIELLSPAQRPIQLTQDLPGFWVGSYKDVRKDMRAQYPKHYWPEDPSVAEPTKRAKQKRP